MKMVEKNSNESSNCGCQTGASTCNCDPCTCDPCLCGPECSCQQGKES